MLCDASSHSCCWCTRLCINCADSGSMVCPFSPLPHLPSSLPSQDAGSVLASLDTSSSQQDLALKERVLTQVSLHLPRSSLEIFAGYLIS